MSVPEPTMQNEHGAFSHGGVGGKNSSCFIAVLNFLLLYILVSLQAKFILYKK